MLWIRLFAWDHSTLPEGVDNDMFTFDNPGAVKKIKYRISNLIVLADHRLISSFYSKINVSQAAKSLSQHYTVTQRYIECTYSSSVADERKRLLQHSVIKRELFEAPPLFQWPLERWLQQKSVPANSWVNREQEHKEKWKAVDVWGWGGIILIDPLSLGHIKSPGGL